MSHLQYMYPYCIYLELCEKEKSTIQHGKKGYKNLKSDTFFGLLCFYLLISRKFPDFKVNSGPDQEQKIFNLFH
jgi:hypothetical protein